MRLFSGIVRHRVPWIQEAGGTMAMETPKGMAIVDSISVWPVGDHGEFAVCSMPSCTRLRRPIRRALPLLVRRIEAGSKENPFNGLQLACKQLS